MSRRTSLSRRALAVVVAAGMSGALLYAAPARATDPRDNGDVVRMFAPDGSTRGEWAVRASPGGTALAWKSDRALPMTSARPEFRVGRRVVGYPTIDGRTLRFDGVAVGDPDDLEVWLGSRRLDGPTPPLRTRALPDVSQAEGRSVDIDPAEPGPYETKSFDYRYGALPWKRYPGDMEVLGQAVVPKGVDDAPLVLFLHGRHRACYGRGDNGDWPCAGTSKPVPSFRGYTYLQRRLATQGYATVSISANAINQQDYSDPDGGALARSRLIRHHLKLLARKTTETGNRWSGRLDMGQVVLVGHSRGGEGANQAVVDTGRHAPYSIVGQLLLAPTDFAQHTAGYTPTVVALPYCDGDVSDLQGQKFVDASVGLARGDDAIRSSVLVRGANHNFFNTEWTPRISAAPSFDDWGDPNDKLCGRKASSTRLTARQQRQVGLVLATGAVRMFVRHDPAMLTLFDASGAVTTDAMGERGLVWSHAVGGARTPRRVGHGGTTASGAASECLATTTVTAHDGLRSCAHGIGSVGRAVHWQQPFYGVVARATLHEVRLDWGRSGRAGGLDFAQPVDLSAGDATLDLRLIATPRARKVRVRLRDDAGATWSRPVRVLRLLAGGWLHPYWAQTVRVDADDAPGPFDSSAVVSVEIVSQSDKGSAWIVDASVRTPTLPDVPDRTLPRLTLGSVTQREGDRSKGVVRLPYRLQGPMSRPARFDVNVSTGGRRGRLIRVNVPAGQRAGSIPLRYRGNDLDDPNRRVFQAIAQPVRGVALHDYQGRAVVRDDDPPPKLTLTPTRATYRAGETIRVRARLSKPAGSTLRAWVRWRDAAGFAPMRGTDVPRRWLRRHGDAAHPRKKLSRSVYGLSVRIRGGERSATLTVPTLRRGPRASTKRVRLIWRMPHQEMRATVATVRAAAR